MKQITVKAIKHVDVNGKELLYLRATNGTQTLNVNIGQKTYDTVLAMENEQTEKPKTDKK